MAKLLLAELQLMDPVTNGDKKWNACTSMMFIVNLTSFLKCKKPSNLH